LSLAATCMHGGYVAPHPPGQGQGGPPTPSPSFEAWGGTSIAPPPMLWPTPYPSFGGTPSESKKFQFEIECDKSNMPVKRGVSRMAPHLRRARGGMTPDDPSL
jgi:hypothetical protein